LKTLGALYDPFFGIYEGSDLICMQRDSVELYYNTMISGYCLFTTNISEANSNLLTVNFNNPIMDMEGGEVIKGNINL
jgi:hypothetical protein